MMTRKEVLDGMAVACGAPAIDPRLSDAQLSKLEAIALAAPISIECGALDSAVGEDAVTMAVNMFRRLLEPHAGVPCQIVFTELGDGTVVINAMTGNGPKSREAARLYAHARDAVLALVTHARAKQAEVDGLRVAFDSRVMGDPEDGGL